MSVDIFGTTINIEVFLYASISLALLSAVLWFVRSLIIQRTLFNLCGASHTDYNLLGTNLIRPKQGIKLVKNMLYGTPAALYLEKNGKSGYVCQYNPRVFNGMPKVRERYQMLLFMGIAMEKYKLENIEGAIRYHDHLETINFEPGIYKDLLNLQDEYIEAVKEWVAPDKQPLFKRDNKL